MLAIAKAARRRSQRLASRPQGFPKSPNITTESYDEKDAYRDNGCSGSGGLRRMQEVGTAAGRRGRSDAYSAHRSWRPRCSWDAAWRPGRPWNDAPRSTPNRKSRGPQAQGARAQETRRSERRPLRQRKICGAGRQSYPHRRPGKGFAQGRDVRGLRRKVQESLRRPKSLGNYPIIPVSDGPARAPVGLRAAHSVSSGLHGGWRYGGVRWPRCLQ